MSSGYPDYGLQYQGQISSLQLYGYLTALKETPELLFYDSTAQSMGALLGMAEAAGQIVSGSVLYDAVLFAALGRVLLQATAGGPALIVDSGGVQLPKCEAYNGLTTAGQGVPVVLAALVQGSLTGASSYSYNLLPNAPAGHYRVSAQLIETTTAGSGNMGVTVTYLQNTVGYTSTVAPTVASGAANTHTEGVQDIRQDATHTIGIVATTNNTTATFLLAAALERLV